MVKEGGSNVNQFYNFDGDGTGNLTQVLSSLKPTVKSTVNPNPQVGAFSKGDIVNVIKFSQNDGFATIENPNYVEPNPNLPKSTGFFGGLDLKYSKELQIPKGYLSKVDDKTPITVKTGINFGANFPIQTINPNYPTKPIIKPNVDITLEENASFVLAKDFQYVTYTKGGALYELGGAGSLQYESIPNYETLPIGTKVTGRLFRAENRFLLDGGGIPPPYNDFLAVKRYGTSGSINIPIEYLTKEVPTNNNSSVPLENNNKNLLLIAGAFVIGYALFSKGESE
jgi:hypothetical protein